jgi:3-phenylpropionate/trans-cinnamate dioxygenase ferredoxin subunit
VSGARRFVVGPLAELPPGTRRRVDVEGRGVVVFNVGGRLFALRDVCPHRGARLSDGTVLEGLLTASEPGCYAYDDARKLVKCPWHGWEFELETGRSWVEPDRTRVRPYSVAVEPGPYTAETVDVEVRREQVVLVLDEGKRT